MAKHSNFFFRVEANEETDPLIISFDGDITSDMKKWLSSKAAIGRYNFCKTTEMPSSSSLRLPMVLRFAAASTSLAQASMHKTIIRTTIWFSDLKTAVTFRLRFN